ncbi:MAG: hypothetical protein M1282_12000 [Chloroflexi bacterium]|nr:hypothetical protein [Chloroflexota bacterium]
MTSNFALFTMNTTKEIKMGEKGQAMLQNMDLVSSISHGVQSVGDFVTGAANAGQQFVQDGINSLSTNNAASTGSATSSPAASSSLQGVQNAISAAATPQSQPAPSGEKGNLQTVSTQFTGQSVEGAASRGSAIASTGIQGGGISPTVSTSPAASPTINPNNPIK